ncbi:MAG: SUMF1/EgtB/PvdO family nonheme iron enzyme [Bacteroidota bacterium]
MLTYRYPGPKPFSTEEASIFFGRSEDVEKLMRRIQQEQLLVLYGKSGLGKSSLLNAGLIPKIHEQRKIGELTYHPLSIRFNAWTEERKERPVTRVKSYLEDIQKSTYLDKLLPDDKSLWGYFKRYQILHPLQSDFVLLFDQFEELFTFPEDQIQDFRDQLSELLYARIPQRYRNAYKEQKGRLTEEEQEALFKPLFKPLNVRAILAIRSDRMHELGELSDKLPAILRERYHLQPLSLAQAQAAIVAPAEQQEEGIDFYTPTFSYHPQALTQILDHLSQQGKTEIESFQLQAICQYVERSLVKGKELKEIQANDLGELSQVFKNYYDELVASLGTEEVQASVRSLIEDGLIFGTEENSRRVSLIAEQIQVRYKIDLPLLNQLVDSHIIRREPDVKGGFLYELAHDTLMAPVLAARERRKAREERERLEREQAKALLEEKKRRDRLTRIISIGGVIIALQIVLITWAFRNQGEAQANAKVSEATLNFLVQKDFSTGLRNLNIAAEKRWDKNQILYDYAMWYEHAFDADSMEIGAQMLINATQTTVATDSFQRIYFQAANYYRDIFRFDWVDTFLMVAQDQAFDAEAITALYLSTAFTARWVRKDGMAREYMEGLGAWKRMRIEFTDDLDGDLKALYERLAIPYQNPREVLVAGGRFMMGRDTLLEPDGGMDELPRHPVRLDTFWMGKYEVTWKEYVAFLNAIKDTLDFDRLYDERWIYWERDSAETGMYAAIWRIQDSIPGNIGYWIGFIFPPNPKGIHRSTSVSRHGR